MVNLTELKTQYSNLIVFNDILKCTYQSKTIKAIFINGLANYNEVNILNLRKKRDATISDQDYENHYKQIIQDILECESFEYKILENSDIIIF